MGWIITAVLLAAAAPVTAADWWLVGANARAAMFVDRSSVERTGSQVVQHIAAVMPGGPIRRIEVVERLDCEAKTATDLQMVYQLSNGQRIRRTPEATPRQLKPDTVGWATFTFGCGSEEARAELGAPVGNVGLEEMAQLALTDSER